MAPHTLTRPPADASGPALTPIESFARARQDSLLPHQPSPAPAADHRTSSPEAWTCRLPTTGELIAIVRTDAEAQQLGSETLVFTMAEVAVAIEALGEAALEAKRTFPGAIVAAVRNGRQEGTGRQPITKHRDSRQTPAMPKAKPLAPSGGYQSLTKKMPPETRYKGESFPAGNVKERYEEQIAKQRAAAALVSGDRDD